MEQETLNKVKKLLYKNKPKALFTYATKNGLLYVSEVDDLAIMFVVPLNDLGDAAFTKDMESQLLIRYINTVNQITDN